MILSGVMGAALRSPVVIIGDGPELIVAAPDYTEATTTSWNNTTKVLTMTNAGDFAKWNALLAASSTYHMVFDYTMSAGSKLRVERAFSVSTVYWTSAVLSSSGHIDVTFTTDASGGDFFLQADSAVFSGTISNISLKKVG